MTTTPTLAQHERRALADSFEKLGPAAPTILPGWTATELMTHLLVREGAPHLLVGTSLPISALKNRAQERIASLEDLPWDERVSRFRSGPPALSLFKVADSWANGIEHLVHHEDLLRAQHDWSARELSAELNEQIMARLRVLSRGIVRVHAAVTLRSGHGEFTTGRPRSAARITVTGTPTELALWAFGREDVAQVTVEGNHAGLKALADGKRGG